MLSLPGRVKGAEIMRPFVVVVVCGATLLASAAQADEEIIELPEVVPIEADVFDDYPVLLKPVVQFSCARAASSREDALEADLVREDDQGKLAALSTLLSMSAPSSVALQYKAYAELKSRYADDQAVRQADAAFNRKRIMAVLGQKSRPEEDFDHVFHWCIRAAGVLKMDESLPRLVELSDTDDLYTHLAAERSIEDFEGKKAEDALIKVVSFWKYNSYVHAADEMMRRNKKRFSRELGKMTPPENCRYQYGLFLSRCDNAEAIPVGSKN